MALPKNRRIAQAYFKKAKKTKESCIAPVGIERVLSNQLSNHALQKIIAFQRRVRKKKHIRHEILFE